MRSRGFWGSMSPWIWLTRGWSFLGRSPFPVAFHLGSITASGLVAIVFYCEGSWSIGVFYGKSPFSLSPIELVRKEARLCLEAGVLFELAVKKAFLSYSMGAAWVDSSHGPMQWCQLDSRSFDINTSTSVNDCWAKHDRMKALVDYVHNKGLKLGIYSDAGYRTCSSEMPGSLGYEKKNDETFAAWGIDYLKYDDCNNRDLKPMER
ncbi:hypothetical protein ZIOFF_068188 [Zingiber officinale]|uniref:Alpha-galactosidase n=1 Tax=Zingiber officinale TaxID=94328 RepID=A0A8J5CXZ5_ZINOF|nr:hypothetical protein ZIOFF_068188 [Zingiber officinale]